MDLAMKLDFGIDPFEHYNLRVPRPIPPPRNPTMAKAFYTACCLWIAEQRRRSSEPSGPPED